MLHFLPVLFIVLRCGYTLNPPINVSSSLTWAPVSRGPKAAVLAEWPRGGTITGWTRERGDGYARWVARGEGRSLAWGEEEGGSSLYRRGNITRILFLAERKGIWRECLGLDCEKKMSYIVGVNLKKKIVYLGLIITIFIQIRKKNKKWNTQT